MANKQKQTIPNLCKDAEKQEFLFITDENVT